MADHVVDRDAAGVLIAFVADGRRGGAGLFHLFFDDPVNLTSGLAGKDMFGNLIKDLGRQRASFVHASKIRSLMDADTVACNAALMRLVHGITFFTKTI